MNILIVSHFPADSASYYRHMGIARVLVKKGHRVMFLFRSLWKWSRPYQELNITKKAGDHGIQFIFWHQPLKYLFLLNSFQVLKYALKADVIHLIRAYPLSAVPTFIAKAISRKPLVDELDDWDGIGGWASLFHRSISSKLVMTFFEEFIPRKSGAVVSVSRTLHGRVKYMQIPRDRLFLIPNSVDVNLFKPMKGKKTLKKNLDLPSGPLIVYVGILYHHEVVNLKILIKMMKYVVKEINDAKLMVIGRGPGLDYLREGAKSYSLENNLLLIHDKVGFVPREEMPNYLGVADVAINLLNSEYLYYHSCSPQSLVEYMAMGLPIVASNVGEAHEALKKGAGILVSGEDPKDYAEAIIKILKDPALGKKLGFEARIRSEKLYSHEVLAKKFVKAYNKARSI